MQYFLPPSGRVWLALNLSQIQSDNAKTLGAATKVRTEAQWASANLFVDATAQLRLGLEIANTAVTYADDAIPINNRASFSAFYIF